MKLWHKGYEIAPLVEHFEAARNAALDAELARHDLWGSLAHVAMLGKIGLLEEGESGALHDALTRLLDDAGAGQLIPQAAQEDIHTVIEQRLITQLGDTGKKVHTGRSRNDQVLVDLRLYAKESLHEVALTLLEAVAQLLALAHTHEWTPLPGYTHMQRAMLSSVGLWASAHADALLDDLVALTAAYTLNDQCPLGSGAAYGSPLPLDREYVAELLGFARPQHNVLAAGNGRGKIEAAIVQSLALIMLDLSKFAQDMLLFTTSEYGFFQVPQELCDGSSMMPQKRNLSALELVRARAHTVIALQSQMMATLAGLPSGYNMDYQETKAPLIESLRICRESLGIVALFASHITVAEDRVAVACTADLFATDRAYALVRAGIPFRDAYQRVAQSADGDHYDLVAQLRARTSTGTAGNLGLDTLADRIAAERAAWEQRKTTFDSAIAALTKPPSASWRMERGSRGEASGKPARPAQMTLMAHSNGKHIAAHFPFAPKPPSRQSLEAAFDISVGI